MRTRKRISRSTKSPRITKAPIQNLDAFRIGWELIENWDHYRCFGLGRAAIIQFSRGCPHHCTTCGQRDFWVNWRYRNPAKVVDEIEWLYRMHATPHGWTEFGCQVKDRLTVQPDLSKWDYRHQVLTQPNLSPWKIFFAVKWLELRFHARPGRWWSILRMKKHFLRQQLLCTSFHTGLLWFGEVIAGSGELLLVVIRSSKKIFEHLRELFLRKPKRFCLTPYYTVV